MGFMIEPSIEGAFDAINQGICVLLFVDESTFCQRYVQLLWVAEEAEIVVVDQELLDVFQIRKVPQWRFYLEGSEILVLDGTHPREQILKLKQTIFGNVQPIGRWLR